MIGKNNYQELNNPENDNQEFDSISTNLPEYSFNLSNIILEISISLIIAFSIFYIILEVHEVSDTNGTEIETANNSIKTLNNSIETIYLVIVSVGICFHIMMYRWRRNCWYSVPFENYPMIIMLCVYGLVELIYYFLNFISSFTLISSRTVISRIISTSCEFIFMITLLPFLMISIGNNVRKNNNWIKLRTKIIIVLSMVGCLLIFTRKTALKLIKDYQKENNETNPENVTKQGIHEVSSRALNLLEIFDINYFIIVFIFLINPLFYLQENEDKIVNINTGLDNNSQNQLSILTWISFVRFRLWSIFISLSIISIIGVSLYISTSLPSDEYIKMIFLILVSIAYLITIIYGIVYYFFYIETWVINENQNLNTDQYFNFITSSAQLVYSSAMLLNVIISNNDKYHVVQIINYFLLTIQVMIQANCINSASKRSIRKFSCDDYSTWKFKLVPSVVLCSLNFISMIISFAYVINPLYSSIIFQNNSGVFMWLFIKDLTLPLTILNRFHGMSFFINLTMKQWY